MNQLNSDGTEQGIDMIISPWEWITDMFYAGIYALGWLFLIAVVGFSAGYGLFRTGWL